MNTETKQKMDELFKDKEYVNHLLTLECDEIAKELKNKGIELSKEEINKICELQKKKKAGELTDDQLEEVSGGGYFVVY